MKFSYGLEVEGMALGEDYEMIKNFLSSSDENYFITGDESIKISDDLIDHTYTLEGEIQEIVPFEIHLGPFTFPNEDDLHTVRWMLRELAYYGALTNDSCAFHMHIKPQKYELHSKQAHWASHLMLAFLIESDRYRNLLHYNNEKMYHNFWASVPAMMEEYKNLKKNIKKDSHCFLDSKEIFFKRGLLHCHPQGTLEWRGIRGLFDNNPRTYFATHSKSFLKTVDDKWKFAWSIFGELFDAFDKDYHFDCFKVRNKLLKMEKDVLK